MGAGYLAMGVGGGRSAGIRFISGAAADGVHGAGTGEGGIVEDGCSGGDDRIGNAGFAVVGVKVGLGFGFGRLSGLVGAGFLVGLLWFLSEEGGGLVGVFVGRGDGGDR